MYSKIKEIREPTVLYYGIIRAIHVDKPNKHFLLFMDGKIQRQNILAKMMLSLLDTQ